MHLLAPWWLLLLLPLAGLLIILYLLKLRRRDFVVPSVFLWEQVLQDLQANVPLQKLRKNLLLLIQMLILLLVVMALSRPAMRVARLGGQSVVLVVDASASMQSTDVAPSRFAAAKKQAHTVIEALGPRDRMMVVAVGGGTRALTSFTPDKRALHGAVDRLQVTDGRADLRGALELAAGLVQNKKKNEKPSIVIISDGAVPTVSLPAGLDVPIHYQKIGKHSDNVGIVMMDARRRLTRQGGYEGLVVLANFSKKAKTFTLERLINDQLADAREITLKAGERRSEVLSSLPQEGGVLTIKLDVKDDLAADNVAHLILPKLEPIHVILATKGNVFLEAALDMPGINYEKKAYTDGLYRRGDVLVSDNMTVASLSPGVSALLIGNAGAAAPGTGARTVDKPAITDWDRHHPVLQYVDLANVFISKSRVLKPAADAHPLIETDAGPVAFSREHGDQRVVYLGWSLQNSDLVLRVAFPIFVGNCIEWLSGQRQREQILNVRTGQVIQLPVPDTLREVTLRLPDGRTEKLGVTGSPMTIDRVTRAGIYQLKGKGIEQQFAANILDAGESNLAPRDLTLQTATGTLRVQREPVRTEREYWRPILLLALLLLCVEWWVFHKRVG